MSLPDYFTWKAQQLGITREQAKACCAAEGYGFGQDIYREFAKKAGWIDAADDGPEVEIIRREIFIDGGGHNTIVIDWDSLERDAHDRR